MKAGRVFLLLALLIPTFNLPTIHADARSGVGAGMERKLRRIESNAASHHPDPAPTEFTEGEINAYFATGKMDLPAGVRSVRFQSEPGIVTGTAHVDFDQFRAGSGSLNPLLGVFTGVHEVVVSAHAHGVGGQGFVQVDSVTLDGIEIPRFILQLFVEKYVQPKYPEIGLNSRFALPDRIDWATVGRQELTVGQK